MTSIYEHLLTRPTYLEIDLGAISQNLKTIRKYIGDTKILCIVKGNAYGHGSIEISRILEREHVDYLGVAIPEEGVELRKAGITTPILVLSGIVDQQIPVCLEYNLSITIPSDMKLKRVINYAESVGKKARIHLKVDTGMSRIGVNYTRIEKFFPFLDSEYIHLAGLYSHFACSDEDHEMNMLQIERFHEVINQFKKHGHSFDIIHMANSGGILFHPSSHFDMVRLGMSLYGLFEGKELPKEIHLIPAMSWKTEVVYFKYVEQGVGIGYGQKAVTDKPTRIVTLPVGYADGYQRAMGEQGKVLIHGKKYPIIGKVCMDQMMVDIGITGEAYQGDEVVLLGNSGYECISFYDIARWSNTSIYELMCQISYRVPRKYKE